MSGKSNLLINKALDLLKKKDYDNSIKYSNYELSEIIHELDVYQAELEIQNNELILKEQELLQSKKEYEMLFFDAPVCYIIINSEGNILKYNNIAIKMFQNIIRRSVNFASLVKSNDYEKYFNWLIKKETKKDEIVLDIKVNVNYEKHKIIAKPYFENEELTLLMLVNVQEQYNLIEENTQLEKDKRLKEVLLLNQEKLYGIGQMLSNVAHQWRQPLNTISIVVSSISYYIKNDKFDKELFLSQLNNASIYIEYLTNTIEQFKSYYSSISLNKSEFNIKDVFDDLKKIISSQLELHNINLIINSEDIKIYKSKTYLIEILLNIIKNSEDAFTLNSVDNPVVIINAKMIEDFVCIDIQDNAGGISDEIIDSVFEPYSTTKHKYVGVGLGLYMVFELINKHFEGTVEAKNDVIEYKNKTYKSTKISLKF